MLKLFKKRFYIELKQLQEQEHLKAHLNFVTDTTKKSAENIIKNNNIALFKQIPERKGSRSKLALPFFNSYGVLR